MNIKAGLNKDTPLELLSNDSIVQAKNILLSNDLETILAENAIASEFNFSSYDDIVGHIDCPTEIVLFFRNRTIARYNTITKTIKTVNIQWDWLGGQVFGTYTYNVKNELIVAISERNASTDVPLKIINLDDIAINNTDDAYTLFPKVPIAESTAKLIDGGSMKIGTYTFFIRYSINEKYKTNWFPIGGKIHLYNSNNIDNLKTIIDHTFQRNDGYKAASLEEANVKYNIKLHDLYCEDIDKTNKFISLNVIISGESNFNNFEIAYICNSKGNTEGFKTNHYNIDNPAGVYNIILNGTDEAYNIDDLTIDNINIYNVNSICNYKNRLYVGDFKEKDRNKNINTVDTTSITIEVTNILSNNIGLSSTDDELFENFIPCTCYQFFLHYVWEDGSFSDGIIINDSSSFVSSVDIDNQDYRFQKYRNVNNEPVYYLGAVYGLNNVIFRNIPRVNNAVACFITYAKLEHSFIGQGLLFDYNSGSNRFSEFTSNKFRAIYPEFSILGGNANITHCIKIGGLVELDSYSEQTNTSLCDLSPIDVTNPAQTIVVNKSYITPPDAITNYGREGNVTIECDQTTVKEKSVYYFINYTKELFDNKYINKNKILIKLGAITPFESSTTTVTILTNKPGYLTVGNVYGTRENGYLINTNQSLPTLAEGETGIGIYARNVIYPAVSIYPLIAKQLNIPPEIIYYSYITYSQSEVQVDFNLDWMNNKVYVKSDFAVDKVEQLRNYIVQATNINSLFKLDVSYYNYINKIYQNYDENKDIYITNKTIRRSDIIADESTDINWRYFRPENYKVITENKGKVKNIVGAGTYLLVHCEHSLFAFDINNVMQTNDKDVQLTMPDVFDVNYKEVFTAEKGFGGIADNTSWIFNEHGYMFYDYSAKKFYRFDNNQLAEINNNIDSLIKTTDFNNTIFGYDKINNRCLVCFKNNNDIINTISYNYKINNWIAEHDIINLIDVANTKDNIYFINNNRSLAKYATNIFNQNIEENIINSYIDILFTDNNSNRIKVLNFITYIVNKEAIDTYNELKLKVYTDTCVTNWISLLNERKKIKDYQLPFYDYDRWNLNHFRNIASNIHNNNDIIDRISGEFKDIPTTVAKGIDNALMVGKYFVVRFVFSNTQKQVILKDIQTYFK